MTTHGTQLSFEEAIRARDASMELVENNAQVEWRAEAMSAIRRCAADNPHFIVDDVWPYMPSWAWTHDSRAMGPCMTRAAKEGVIAPTEEYRLSERVSSHRNPRRVWAAVKEAWCERS